ncbi:MAG: peptidase domain-containing ABC transporter [Marinilabiliales bacterium]|nr:MAG: peptidase domain-containing ABC transporter [Marinilabiliales bacterium]
MPVPVKQRDITDCGAACLASVASHYGMQMPVSKIRQFAGTDKRGTNVLGLVEASKKMGFLAKGVRGEFESLFKIPKPAIAHIIVNETLHHYVVLVAATSRCITVMDPAEGKMRRISHEEFRKQWTGVLVILYPGREFTPLREKVTPSLRLWHLVRPNAGVLFQALCGALLFSVLGLSTAIFVGRLVDNVIPSGNANLLNLLGIAMAAIIMLRVLLSIFQWLFVLKTGQKIDAGLIMGYYRHLMKLPQSFFDNMRTGEIISRIGDAVKIRAFINDVSINLIVSILILIVSFALMFTYYWKMALVILVVVPAYAIIYLVYDRLNRKVQRRVMERAADLEAQLVESLSSAGTIKRFALEEIATLKTETRFVDLLGTAYRSGLNNIFSGGATSFVTQLLTLIVLWAGAGYVLGNSITPGELLSFYAVTGYFTAPVADIIGFNRNLQDAFIAADRLFEIFDLESEQCEGLITLNAEMTGDIVFNDVAFRYGTRVDVFDNLNLRIPKGKVTAIAGESGSGKTTLASLLQNIYPLLSGRILIGDHDIRRFSSNSLRRVISVVPQRIDIFSGSVTENIALDDFDPDMEKILHICRKLGMNDFVEELPAGYNTLLGENGSNLSGGQKQRIAIARALYRDPAVLILDEATSSLDSLAEEYVRSAIEHLRSQGRTVIVIAHRLSTLSIAEHVIMLERGRLVQEGSFHELISADGPFRRMWEKQVPAFGLWEENNY